MPHAFGWKQSTHVDMDMRIWNTLEQDARFLGSLLLKCEGCDGCEGGSFIAKYIQYIVHMFQVCQATKAFSSASET